MEDISCGFDRVNGDVSANGIGESMTIGTISIIVGVVLLILLKIFFKGGEKSNWNEAGREVDDIVNEELFFLKYTSLENPLE